ncbi:hypothetical protein BC835DRAFT_1098649 [Cytidiella melzeri]|nr:hypothetical protein BC835DRAFT_1098649 [Cytidiella melzeri]
MSEHDRAAKAARARALLKKRQQAKATGPAATGDSRVASPSPAHSRPSTPAIAEVHPPLATASDHGSNGTSVNDLFTNGNGHTDSHWLSSLDRVETPSSPSFASGAPPTTSPPPRAQAVPPSSAGIHAPKPIVPGRMSQPVTSPISDDKEHDDLRSLIQDQARVIASLEAERNTLAASAEQLKQLESRLQQANDLLGSEQSKTEKLQGFLEHAEQEVEQMTNLLDEQKDLVSTLEQEKGTLLRQLAGARTGSCRIAPGSRRPLTVHHNRCTTQQGPIARRTGQGYRIARRDSKHGGRSSPSGE